MRSSRQPVVRIFCGLTLALLIWLPGGGCKSAPRGAVDLPATDQFEREQLRIHSDIRLPRKHRLLDELTARRRDISEKLCLPVSDEPIHVYLFDDPQRFAEYMEAHHPDFPKRRAFFVKNDTDLRVYAHWGPQVGEDLRHEVTHGYLHSVVNRIPLWLDEGLAEYFELPRGSGGFHRRHVVHLVEAARSADWVPDLLRLESLPGPAEMTQTDYAEAWLWVHFLLNTSQSRQQLLQDQLARWRLEGDAGPFSDLLHNGPGILPVDYEAELVDHLEQLAHRAAAE